MKYQLLTTFILLFTLNGCSSMGAGDFISALADATSGNSSQSSSSPYQPQKELDYTCFSDCREQNYSYGYCQSRCEY